MAMCVLARLDVSAHIYCLLVLNTIARYACYLRVACPFMKASVTALKRMHVLHWVCSSYMTYILLLVKANDHFKKNTCVYE